MTKTIMKCDRCGVEVERLLLIPNPESKEIQIMDTVAIMCTYVIFAITNVAPKSLKMLKLYNTERAVLRRPRTELVDRARRWRYQMFSTHLSSPRIVHYFTVQSIGQKGAYYG